MADLYARSTSHQVLVLETPALAEGMRTLRLRVTGAKDRKFTGAEVVPDRIDVLRLSAG